MEHEVANAIYTTTRDGLADLVSRQAADRLLREAVASSGADPDTVDARAMSRLLRGKVRRELERTLPRAGVRRRLAHIDRRLTRQHADALRPTPRRGAGRQAGSPPTAPAPTTSAPSRDAAERRADVDTPPATVWRREPADVATEAQRRRAFPVAGDPELTAVGSTRARPATVPPPPSAPVADEPVEDASATPAAAPAPRPQEPPRVRPRPDALIERVAEREGVRQWVWCPEHGRPEARGDGPPPERVAAALGPLVTVLGRHGPVRSLHVRHGRGQVLVGFDRGSSLTVAGDDGLNLGAIYATFRALEEEP
jgi:hypothetical protein